MTKPALLFLVALLLTAACAPPPAPAPDLEAELAALNAAAAAYHEAATAKDAARVVALYDEGAVMVPPNADLVDGLQGVKGYPFGFINTPGVELHFEIVRSEISATADMGWTLALGDITINRPDGTVGSDLIRDFHVWKKQADGSWKVVADIWNSGIPLNPR
ncbi:MAG: YybH family protein [Longimicrobiales bacterium]